MNIIQKYNIYKELRSSDKEIIAQKHFTNESFETAIKGNTKLLAIEHEQDYHGAGGPVYSLSLTKVGVSPVVSHGLFAMAIYNLLKNKYNSKKR